MDVAQLKKELAALGAKTSGTKKLLERRLALWKEKGLNKSLLDIKPVALNIKNPIIFPKYELLHPLALLKGEKLINLDCIESFFTKNMAKKGKEKGRILAMKLFIKYTRVLKENEMFYIKSKCCAEQKKSVEYDLKLLIKRNLCANEIVQSSCSCSAGTGYSAACKHIGALCFSLEYFSITENTQEYISWTSSQKTWNKPTGKGVDFMSIYEINNDLSKEEIVPCDKYTHNIINRLLNRNIDCSLTNSRKVSNIANYIEEHSYCFLPR